MDCLRPDKVIACPPIPNGAKRLDFQKKQRALRKHETWTFQKSIRGEHNGHRQRAQEITPAKKPARMWRSKAMTTVMPGPHRLEVLKQTNTAFTIWAGTCGSGARIGGMMIARTKFCAALRG